MIAAGDSTRCPDILRWCHHCAGPVSKDTETSSWTVPPLVRHSFSMIGSALGGIAGAFYGFNHVMPVVRRHIKGPMWMHFFVGAPPVIVFSSACAGLAGGTIPATAQLFSSSYHAVPSHPFARSSHVAAHSHSFAPSQYLMTTCTRQEAPHRCELLVQQQFLHITWLP